MKKRIFTFMYLIIFQLLMDNGFLLLHLMLNISQWIFLFQVMDGFRGRVSDVYINSYEKIHTISIMNALGETLYHEHSINQAFIILELTVQSER